MYMCLTASTSDGNLVHYVLDDLADTGSILNGLRPIRENSGTK